MQKTQSPIKLRYYAEYYLTRLLRGLLFILPIDVASFVMGKMWRLIGPLNSRHKRVLRHMEWALGGETNHKDREIFAREMWENLGRTFAEGLISDRLIHDPHRFSADSAVFADWVDNCRNGSLLVTHHFGNWELSSLPTVIFSDHKVMGIYRRVKNPLVERFFLAKRSHLFPGGLYSQSGGAARQAVMRVKSGTDMAMVADLRDNRGVTVNLFGMPATMSGFPATLAIKFKKPVFVAQLRRLSGAHFKLDIHRIDAPDTGDFDADCTQLTQLIFNQFEAWIRTDPAQWMWAPYRWSARRDEESKPLSWAEHQATLYNAPHVDLDN